MPFYEIFEFSFNFNFWMASWTHFTPIKMDSENGEDPMSIRIYRKAIQWLVVVMPMVPAVQLCTAPAPSNAQDMLSIVTKVKLWHT